MAETDLWRVVRGQLGHYGVFKRIENVLESGTPDVTFCVNGRTGWLELKQADAPKRWETAVVLRHLTKAQIDWAIEWNSHGGTSLFLVQVGTFTALMEPRQVNFYRPSEGGVRLDEMEGLSLVLGKGRFPTMDILKKLTSYNRKDR